MRLAMIYALADRSATISRQHLEAGLAVWAFCRDSARLLFGEAPAQPEPSPEPVWLKLLNLIQGKPGICRSELLRGCRSVDADALDEALASLAGNGMACRTVQKHEAGGRPAECWWPGTGQQPGTGLLVDNPPPLLPLAHEADGKEGNHSLSAGSPVLLPEGHGKEGNNSWAASPEVGAGKEGNIPLPGASTQFFPSFPQQSPKDQAGGQFIPSFPADPCEAHEGEGGEVVVNQTAEGCVGQANDQQTRAELAGVEEFLAGLQR
jgi:hypothetical protein